MKIRKEHAQWAMDAQSACNLSGLVHSFHRIISEIWEDVRAEGGGTDDVNHHPVCRMFAQQIFHLTRGPQATSYPWAYFLTAEVKDGELPEVIPADRATLPRPEYV